MRAVTGVMDRRLRPYVASATACWTVFRQVNRNPDVLPPWPATAVGRLVWGTLAWFSRGSALVFGAALGALLGVDAQSNVQNVFDQVDDLLGIVAVVVGLAAYVRVVGWVARVFIYAGTQGAHSKRPREVVENVVLWSILLATALATAFVGLD
jgi:cytochrome bd-type quinol oxidase subunit 2